MALVDLETEVKPWLEIAPTDTTSDDVLQLCMEGATEFFESYCDRVLEEDSLVHQFNGSDQHVLRLREFPITSVWFAAIDPDWQFTAPLDLSSLLVDNEAFLVRKIVWPKGIRNIQISYDAGYNTDDIPVDLRLIALQMVEFLYKGRGDHRLGVTNRSKLGESLTFQDTVPKNILDMLQPYTRKVAMASLLARAGGG